MQLIFLILYVQINCTKGLKYPGLPSYSDDPGKIYTLNLLDSELKLEALSIKGQFDKDSFNPHGISVYTDDKGLAFSLNIYIYIYINKKSCIPH